MRRPLLLVSVPLFTLALCSQEPTSSRRLPEGPSPQASSSSLDEANKAIHADRFAEAETKLRLYLAHDNGSATAHYMLAYSLLRQGKAKDSLTEYTRAATLRTPAAVDLRNVGQAYLVLEDYPDAGKWLQRSLQMDANDGDTWYNLGRLRYAENRFTESIEALHHVLDLAPRNPKAENNIGLALEGLNKLAEAEAAYRQAIAWQNADPRAIGREQPLLNLAILMLHRGGIAEAQTLLEQAVSLAPKDPRVQEQLGQVFLQESKFAEAQAHLVLACQLDPGRGNLHFLLGQAEKHLGHNDKARQEFAEAARLSRVSNQRAN